VHAPMGATIQCQRSSQFAEVWLRRGNRVLRQTKPFAYQPPTMTAPGRVTPFNRDIMMSGECMRSMNSIAEQRCAAICNQVLCCPGGEVAQ